jgi:hypothetical protein
MKELRITTRESSEWSSRRMTANYELRIKEKGQLTMAVLLFGSLAIIILGGLIIWVDSELRTARRANDQALALRIAEAGIEYYRWHLAHSPIDFQDGTGQPGPYTHDYKDKDGNVIGQFILDITPPELGETMVIIQSTGKISVDSSIEKIIRVKMGGGSLVRFAAVSNTDIYFPPGTEVFGPVHSNGGVHFDGIAHNIVTSARTDYNDPEHSGNEEYGVHTHVAPADPLATSPPNVPNRPDVFMAGRKFPVPAIDFAGFTSALATIKSDAQSGGNYFGPAEQQFEGYHIVLKTNDTFDLYKVSKLVSSPNGCTNVVGQQDWGTWSIEQEQLIQNYPFPANGTIFFEDTVWVDGQINGARLTIAAGSFPENPAKYEDIIVNKDLLYTNYDGTDVIGLIAQGDFTVGWVSEDDLRIDGAVVSHNRRVGRNYYRGPTQNQERCSPYHIRQLLTMYGMVASFETYGFSYTDGTGYLERKLIYDPNLLFSPPPRFPGGSQYELISWEEVK